jgi:hypothetical protein
MQTKVVSQLPEDIREIEIVLLTPRSEIASINIHDTTWDLALFCHSPPREVFTSPGHFSLSFELPLQLSSLLQHRRRQITFLPLTKIRRTMASPWP